ncbi:MAG: PIG-L family deacetylase [Chloroflexi bacterium]|nr:PIG-L family deacetylase [Chloroflexota bacterium]
MWRQSVSDRPAEPALEPLPEDWTRALAIAAHPDDLEYGASSAVARWTRQGKEVTYLLATRGEAGIDAWPPERAASVREAEERESARLVGVDRVTFLDYRDGIVEYGLPLRRDLAREIRRVRPEAIVTLSFDLAWPGGTLNQADHRTVGLAVLDAARDAGNRWIFPELGAEGLEPWGGTRYIFVSGVHDPTHGCDVTDGLDAGIASLVAQHAYFENLGAEFDPAAFLRERAEQVGRRLGCPAGAAFRVYRV